MQTLACMRRTNTSTLNVPVSTVGLALAACAFALAGQPMGGAGELISLQLTPAGDFKPSDGREMPVSAWHIDAAVATRVIERFNQRKTPPVIDYEHQTLHKETNGQPAPAAGFMSQLRWDDGKGLYAVVELTERARGLIQSGEYRYFSPVFTFDKLTGDVLDILMGALTNHPAIDGMEPLALRAAATFGINHPTEKSTMNPLLAALLAALSLPATTTEEQATAALTALGPINDAVALRDGVRKALGLDDKADSAAVVAACTSLKAAKPDPAQYVPVGALTQVQTELAALTATMRGREVDEVVQAALADGRLLAGEQETWARDLGKTNLAALTSYLKTAQPIAALSGTQTGGRKPNGPAGGEVDSVAVATAAVKYQADQSAAGVNVSTAEAVDHILKKQGA